MREILREYMNKSIVVKGRIVEMGGDVNGNPEKMYMLIKDVTEVDGTEVAQHTWVRYRPQAFKGQIAINALVVIKGTPERYGKGYGIKAYRVEVIDNASY